MASRSVLSGLPKKSLKVGLVQMTSTDEVMANVVAALKALKQLRGQGCRLICLPENALYLRLDKSRPIDGGLNLKESFWTDFSRYAKEENCVLVFGSIAFRKGKKLANATVVIEPGKKPRAAYEKIHLFDVDVKGAPPSRESEFFAHGRRAATIKVDGWNIGLSICYDVRFSELYRQYAGKKAHLILVPAAFLVPTGRAHWHVLLRARAIESQAFVVAAAQSGGHANKAGHTRETFGHSLVVGPWGEVELDMGEARASTAVVMLDPAALALARRQIPMENHRRLRL